MMTSLHERIQNAILKACEVIDISAQKEYRGNGYRADVMVF